MGHSLIHAGGQRGAVAAGHRATAEAAAVMIDAGGTAADAAVAGLLAACIAEPLSASLGGAGLAVVRSDKGVVRVYDAMAHTPRQRNPHRAEAIRTVTAPGRGQEVRCGLGTVAVPAVIPFLFALHADLGRMPLAEVAAPALTLARIGAEIDAAQARMQAVSAPLFVEGSEAHALLATTEPEDGHRRRPAALLAAAIDALIHEGPDLYRRGEIGQRLVESCAQGGGHVSAEDLRAVHVPLVPAVSRPFRGATVHLPPPPAHGGVLAGLLLDLVDRQPGMTSGGWGAEPHRAALAEAHMLVAEAWAAAREADRLDPARTVLGPEPVAALRDAFARRMLARAGTTHLAVGDAAGRLVSLSLTCGEGAGEAIPGIGILLNNLLAEDGEWPKNMRISSVLSPLINVLDENCVIALGCGGGRKIPGLVAQVVINCLAFGLPLDEAILRPRLHVPEGEGRTLHTEDDLPQAMAGDWAVHQWPEPSAAFGAAWAVARDKRGTFTAATDPRRPGWAITL